MALEPFEGNSAGDTDPSQAHDLSPAELAEREARFAVVDRLHARLADVPEAEVLEDIAAAIAAVRAARREADSTPAPPSPAPLSSAPGL
jgi:hypothetical protein